MEAQSMIENLEVRNFQSLQKVDLELGQFTVIVGQSSSGKSALVRALSTLFSNRAGTDFISHGTTTSVITATLPEGKVSLSRSTASAKNKYTVIKKDGETETYTKLNRNTPEEVSDFLKVEAKDSVVLAQQFDRPFLLADSPAQAAQTLGELTNVSLIFESSREANRQRLAASATLKTKSADLDGIESRLKDFEDLEGRFSVIREAGQRLTDGEQLQKKLDRLGELVNVLRDTKIAIATAQEAAQVEIPSTDAIESAHSALLRFEEIIRGLKDANASIKRSRADSEEAETLLDTLSTEYNAALHELGTCPTCGSVIG